MKKKIKKGYGQIEIDQRESDVILIWGETDTNDPQVVAIKREDLEGFIKILRHGKTNRIFRPDFNKSE